MPARRWDTVGKGRDEHHRGVETGKHKKSGCDPSAARADHINALRSRADHAFNFAWADYDHFLLRAVHAGQPFAVFGREHNLLDGAKIRRRFVEVTD